MKIAKAKAGCAGNSPSSTAVRKLTSSTLVHGGEYSTLEVAELFGVGRSTVRRVIERQRVEVPAGLAEATSKR